MSAIRLIGHDHTSHHHGEILMVAPDAIALVNRNTVTAKNAADLVAKGRAVWVGEPPEPGSGQIAPGPSHEEEKAAAKIVRHHDEEQIDDPQDPDQVPDQDPDFDCEESRERDPGDDD